MLEIKNLTHRFGEKLLYKDVNLKINKGDKIGLVGDNGTGKSTLINLLNGNILNDEGELIWESRHKVGYLDQFAQIDKSLTIYDYLESAFYDLIVLEEEYNSINEKMATANAEEIDKLLKQSGELFEYLDEHNYYSISNEVNKIASGLGVASFGLQTKIGDLSGGQRVKVMLVKLLLEKPELLILDEPTNFLDTQHIEWLVKFLQNYKGSFLIVSHDIPFLDSVVNKIWSITMQSINSYPGNYKKFLQISAEKQVLHNKLAQTQAKQEEKLKDYIARNGVRASTAKQAKSREKALEKLQNNKLEIIKESNPPEFNFQYKNIDNTHMLVVKNLAVGYDKILVDNITFTLLNAGKLRINGFNGVGKSTLMKTLMGEIKQIKGTININKNVILGYYEQDHNFIDKENTAIQEMSAIYPKFNDKEVRTYLARAGLSTKKQMQPISSLSGGEQCKIQIAILMATPCNLLLLDEPTNHLDVKAKQVLADAINKFRGGVIFVSHENDFAQKIENCKELNLADL